jgi:hypothetical protein
MIQKIHKGNSPKPIIRFLTRLLGCRHSHMSRLFTVDDEPYRTCLRCGARQRVDRYSRTRLHPYYF